MSAETEQDRVIAAAERDSISRRAAIERVTALLGGIALVGSEVLLTGCAPRAAAVRFTARDIAFLDEVADTILPETSTPGAKAAGVGPFMAHMVNATYDEREQRIFYEGMRTLDRASRAMHQRSFVEASPEQRLALLQQVDREQKEFMDAREAARRERAERAAAPPRPEGAAELPDQRREGALGTDVGPAVAITADAPTHYFRMMKELALLGYFTSEIGYYQAMRYVETPGHFDPCTPYAPGDRAWAPHA
jgi:hypothetical protein